MFYRCAFNEKFLLDEIEKSPNFDLLKKAMDYFNSGQLSLAHDICKDLSDKTPVSLVLSSIFSRDGESEEEFESRHINLLKTAAKQNDAFALYSLAVYFETGDMVEVDKKLSESFYEKASMLGMPLASHIYGIMLYYGTENTVRNKKEGLKLVRYASKSGVSDADVFLESLKENN